MFTKWRSKQNLVCIRANVLLDNIREMSTFKIRLQCSIDVLIFNQLKYSANENQIYPQSWSKCLKKCLSYNQGEGNHRNHTASSSKMDWSLQPSLNVPSHKEIMWALVNSTLENVEGQDEVSSESPAQTG